MDLNSQLKLHREDELEQVLDGLLHFDDRRGKEGHTETGNIRSVGSPSVCPRRAEGLQRHALGFILHVIKQVLASPLICSVKGSVVMNGLCCITSLLF